MAEVFRRKQALRFYCTGIQDFFASVRRTCAFAIFVCMLNILVSTPSTLAMDAERLHLRQWQTTIDRSITHSYVGSMVGGTDLIVTPALTFVIAMYSLAREYRC